MSIVFTRLTTTADTVIKAKDVLIDSSTPTYTNYEAETYQLPQYTPGATPGGILGAPIMMMITNTDATGDSCVLDLYLTDSSATHYILRRVNIPSGAALVLDRLELEYDPVVYDLKCKLESVSAAQTLVIKTVWE